MSANLSSDWRLNDTRRSVDRKMYSPNVNSVTRHVICTLVWISFLLNLHMKRLLAGRTSRINSVFSRQEFRALLGRAGKCQFRTRLALNWLKRNQAIVTNTLLTTFIPPGSPCWLPVTLLSHAQLLLNNSDSLCYISKTGSVAQNVFFLWALTYKRWSQPTWYQYFTWVVWNCHSDCDTMVLKV